MARLARWCRRIVGGGALAPRGAAPGTCDLGRRGEVHAERYLRRAGYRVLDRNVRVPMGEADLVAEAPDGRTLVLVEVKCRVLGDGRHPPPEAQVHARKRRKLRAILGHLVRANRWQDRPRRIDVVAVDWGDAGPAGVRHYVDAVR